MRTVAIDLDGVLGDTRPLWRDWLEDAARRFHSIAPLDPEALPDDRGEAAAELDRWAEASAALRALGEKRCRLGVFTDAPEAFARIAVAQLGAARRVEAVEAGAGALERLRERFGPETIVVRDPTELDLQSRS